MVPKLRFKEFCGEWEDKRLGDVIQYFYNGQTPSRNNLNFWNGNIPWVSSGELNYNTIKCTNEYITEDGKRNAHLKLLPKGTFLIAITGLEAAGTRGSCAFLGIDATTNQSCMALVPYEKKLNSKFLFQWYMKIGEHYGIKYTQGTKQQSYNIDLLKRLPIILPDNLYEQTKIADFLSTVDDKIQNQQDKITHLENIKKGFMQKIFSRKIRFKDEGGDEFPEWEEKKLGDIGNIITGNTPSTHDCNNYGEEYLWCSPIDLGSKKYIDNTNTKLSEKGFNKTRKIPKNSIMVTCIGSTIGKIGICTTEMSTNQQINSIVVNENNYYEFVYYSIIYNFYKFLSYISVQAVPIINKSQFENLKIMLPCLKEQQKISDFLSSFDEKISTEKETLEHLKQLKKGLLQKMLV